tara:strand:- start:76 stop:543 length:468 start_codon:yes stop_codon:yes gene_type:complete
MIEEHVCFTTCFGTVRSLSYTPYVPGRATKISTTDAATTVRGVITLLQTSKLQRFQAHIEELQSFQAVVAMLREFDIRVNGAFGPSGLEKQLKRAERSELISGIIERSAEIQMLKTMLGTIIDTPVPNHTLAADDENPFARSAGPQYMFPMKRGP